MNSSARAPRQATNSFPPDVLREEITTFKWNEFQIGFWHPFGSYAGLSVDSILEWKRRDTERYGWTFWSFAGCRISAWLEILRDAVTPVYVLCSDSPNAKDPDTNKDVRFATSYQWEGDETWIPMPDRDLMSVTNPFKNKNMACAFKVRRVIDLTAGQRPEFSVEWYEKSNDQWRQHRLPTRGQFLIRGGSGPKVRPIRAVLELMPPYLARLRSSDSM